jgi:hypothetical protein
MKNPSFRLAVDAKTLDSTTPPWHAAANGFAPRNIIVEEAHVLYHACYLAPPDMRLPSEWRLSRCGIGIPPIPVSHGTRRWEDIHAHRATLTAEERTCTQLDLRIENT